MAADHPGHGARVASAAPGADPHAALEGEPIPRHEPGLLLPAKPYGRLTVIGGGAWGTALALTALRAGRGCSLWIREADVAERARKGRRTPFLPDQPLPEALAISCHLQEALEGAELAVLAVPSQFLRRVAHDVQAHLHEAVPVVICSKGIETKSGALMHQVVEEAMPGRAWAALSGPSFAVEVAEGQPTAVTVAAPDTLLAVRVAATFASPVFRPYTSDDPVGAEVGGAVKNVLAIACGIASGCGFGSNARAGLITRGLAEITRLGVALGARQETFAGLAGLGDLTLTCSSEQSRNFSFGMALGRGMSAEQAQADSRAVVEGTENARSVTALARKLGVEMPICEAVFAILYRGLPVEEAMQQLLTRPLKGEVEREPAIAPPPPSS